MDMGCILGGELAELGDALDANIRQKKRLMMIPGLWLE